MSKKTKTAPVTSEGETNSPTAEQMRALIEQEQQKRIAECQRMIIVALETTRCRFDVRMTITEQRNIPEITIVAND